ncbi:MAG: Pr6Pr family membrane protein [Rickettsiales bacterium]|nr:Pr6Pr family membrane protein [Rickettsiales bacterium]
MKWFRGCIGVLAAGCVVLQYITPPIEADTSSPLAYTIRYFSFFTIQSNLFAAMVLLMPLMSRGRLAEWLDSAKVRAAVVLYLAVTGLIYFTLLRHTWNPQGLTYVADRGLHYVVPCLVALEWWFFAAKRGLSRPHLMRWAIFPVVYFCVILIQGAISGFYPYPFFNAAQLGYGQVLLAGVALLGVFMVLGAVIIRVARLRAS